MGVVRLRPLASSLDPLPGEALSGFLLRLAYRLELSPARVARITGLTAADGRSAVVPFALLVDLPAAQRASFAAAARLTEAEAAALCLSDFAGRYPSAAPEPGDRSASRAWSGARATGAARWIYDRVVRWCPECLAGDGTRVQDQLGGAWSKTWRLAVVFGCTRHQRLLEHICPGCSRPVTEPHGRVVAVPYAHRLGMHPACCRLPDPDDAGYRSGLAPACGTSLTTALPLALTDAAFRLQCRIFDLLNHDQPGETVSVGSPASAGQYFTDLRLIAGLVRASWPRVSSLTDVPAALGELADRDRQAANGKVPRQRVHDEPPPDAAASSALLTIADQLLGHDPRNLAQHILHMLAYDPRRAGRIPWTRTFLEERPDCSPGFRRAPVLQSYAPRPREHKRKPLKTPVYPTGYGPAQVAQFLEEDWYQRYLAGMNGVNAALLRRTAALFLCQLAASGSLADAAELLGLPNPDRAYTGAKFVQRWARARPDPREFENAVHDLAEHLGQSAGLIDYGKRRQAMNNWCIGPGDWALICAQLGPYHPFASGIQLGDRRRQTASMIVWARVTQGEHLFAPHPIRDQQPPDVQEAWRMSDYAAWNRIQKNQVRHVDADLYRVLYVYADELAARFDNGGQPTIE